MILILVLLPNLSALNFKEFSLGNELVTYSRGINQDAKNDDSPSEVVVPTKTFSNEWRFTEYPPYSKKTNQNIFIEPDVIMDQLINDNISICITAIGDCTLGNDSRFLYETSFNYIYNKFDNNGYDWFFSHVRHIFEEDDLTIANLEGVLSNSRKKALKTHPGDYFHFRGKPEYAAMLKEAGVDALNLANNHSFDYMLEGYNDTIQHLDENDLVSFGENRSPVLSIKGVKVGLLGFNVVCHLEAEKDISEFKNQMILKVEEISRQSDVTIASFHWGEEKATEPNGIQIELGRAAVDAGADLVLGHHPHTIQCIEKYRDKYIVYSLGNFCFGGHPNPSDKDTFIFQQVFLIDKEKTWLRNLEPVIYPCSISSTQLYNDYRPTILEVDEWERIFNRLTPTDKNIVFE